MPHELFVDHALDGLAERAEPADASVADLLLGIFFLLQDRDGGGFFLCCRKVSGCHGPWLKGSRSVYLAAGDHCATGSIFACGLFCL